MGCQRTAGGGPWVKFLPRGGFCEGLLRSSRLEFILLLSAVVGF